MLPIASVFIVTILTLLRISLQDAATARVPLVLYADDAYITEFPYFASLDLCGAAILSEKWLVTAAHCVEDPNLIPEQIVYVGGENISSSQKVSYKRVIIHPDYAYLGGIPLNDIALIQLKKNLKFSDKIQPIEISDQNDGTELLFVGNGVDETGYPSKSIRKLNLKWLTTQQCLDAIPRGRRRAILDHLSVLEKVNICARRNENKPGICSGDSGSPLTQNNKLVGLASYIGNKCSESRLNFFTNVITYGPWIKSITGLK